MDWIKAYESVGGLPWREMPEVQRVFDKAIKQQQQGEKDMSIKEKMEVGQTWDNDTGTSFRITGLGEDSFLYKLGTLPENWLNYYPAEDWTLTHLADGTPVTEPVGEIRKMDVKRRGDDDDGDFFMDIAMAHKDYICWEDEEGNLHGVFRHKDGGRTTVYLDKDQWDSGYWVEVKPVKLWFRPSRAESRGDGGGE